MLGHVGRGAAILAAERETLQQAHQHERDRCRDADRRVRREHADHEGRHAHEDDRDEEGVFAADEVPEPPEHERAERAHRKAGREGEQCEDEGRGGVHAGEELPADDRGEGTVEVEVVPLEDRAE